MRYYRLLHRHALFFAAALAFSAAPAANAARKPPAQPEVPLVAGAMGVFEDRTGARHEWQVNAGFGLSWDGAPYLPVGTCFTARSLAEPDKPDAWAADQEALRAQKQAGVLDVYVRPPLGATPTVAAWQRLVDFLDAEGFHYGLGITPPPIKGASGYYVHSGSFRLAPLAITGDYAMDIRLPGVAPAAYQRVACVITTVAGKLCRVDWARLQQIEGGVRATVSVTVPDGERDAVEFVPMIANVAGLPDFWNGFDDARDALLAYRQLKAGAGLRFLSHPFGGTVNLDSTAGYVIPDSDAYHTAFEAFLTRKYRGIDTLRGRWAFRGDLPDSIETAARLVPLCMTTVNNDHVGYLLDEKALRCYAIAVDESTFWYDHLYFREDSIRGQMNLLAQFLRQQLADVPVVLRRSGDLRYYNINDQPTGGFSGIGMEADLVHLLPQAGLEIGEARLAAVRPWCIALGMDGFTDKDGLWAAMESLRSIGLKGWFVDPGAAPAATVAGWLAGYRAAKLAKPDTATYAPRYVLYPHSVRETGGFGRQHPTVDVETHELAPGIWWVPTVAIWHTVDVGTELRAYAFGGGIGDDIYLWSPAGKRRINVRPAGFGTIEVRDITGKVIRRQKDNDRMRLDLDERPLIISGMVGSEFAPIEVAKQEVDELERLVKQYGVGHTDVRELQRIVALARKLDPDRNAREVRDLVRAPLQALREALKKEAASTGVAPPSP